MTLHPTSKYYQPRSITPFLRCFITGNRKKNFTFNYRIILKIINLHLRHWDDEKSNLKNHKNYVWALMNEQRTTIFIRQFRNNTKRTTHKTSTPCSLPGFNRLRMHTQYKPTTSNQPSIQQLAETGQGTTLPTANHIPVAFVEFRDVHCAGQAMQLLQGKYLLSSDRGAIRIEYAKSKMAANEQLHHFSFAQMMPPHGCFQPSPILSGNFVWQH